MFSGPNGELVTQFDKDKVEDAGLIKFDFLGLKTLDVIAQAEKLVNRRIEDENRLSQEEIKEKLKAHPHANRSGDSIPHLTIEQLAPERKEVFDLIGSGDTLGIFQIESGGFSDMCRRLKPDCFEDIIAAGALYRPGPMQSGMVDDFIDRKHGKKKVVYPHPLLESVLKPTYGTIIYQEQVLQAAQVLAGFTLGAADILRRAMGKKKFEEMEKQRAIFVAGAEKNGVKKEAATLVFDTIEKFAGYGFNKSHSAAYALITYQTAYLKKFYPVEFMAALLTTSSDSTDDVVKYIREARAQGIPVLPPDINISMRHFTVDYGADRRTKAKIRFGLGAVKGLGDAALEAILAVRNEREARKTIYQFCQQLFSSRINKKVLEALIKSGAMDGFLRPRKQLMMVIDRAMSEAQRLHKDKSRGQTNMFELFTTEQSVAFHEEYPDVGEYSQKEKLQGEKEALGFYLSGHPLDPYDKVARALGAIPTAQLTGARHLEEISLVGVVSELKERPLKSGKGRWAVVLLEDSFGQAEILCFSSAYDNAERLLKTKEPLLVTGRALIDDGDEDGAQPKPKLRLKEVRLLAEAQMARMPCLKLDLRHTKVDDQTLLRINQAVTLYPGDKPVHISFLIDRDTEIELRLPKTKWVMPSNDLMAHLEKTIDNIKFMRD